MQNPIQKIRLSSIVFENLDERQYPTLYFLLKLRTRFLLTKVYKRVCRIFLFSLDLELFAKIKKIWFHTLVFDIFINNSRPKQNLKNPEHPFLDIIK